MRLKVKEFDEQLIDKLKERAEPLPTDQEDAMPTYEHYNNDVTTEKIHRLQMWIQLDMSYMTDNLC